MSIKFEATAAVFFFSFWNIVQLKEMSSSFFFAVVNKVFSIKFYMILRFGDTK